MTKIAELYGHPTAVDPPGSDWAAVVAVQQCPFLGRKCLKNRKSTSDVTIGSCTVNHGSSAHPVMICPFRLLERRQIFMDCQTLLTLHEAGNEWHIVPELEVPGGSIDYCLASVRRGKVIDFAGVELQTLDTTGTVWPERQRFLHGHRVRVRREDRLSARTFGLNWKMTAKTVLMQLHHKVATFEHLSKHLILVVQDHLLNYMKRAFTFSHLQRARVGDPMHFHSYILENSPGGFQLQLADRLSTDANGIAKCLGMQSDAKVELQALLQQIEGKLGRHTLLSFRQPLPSASLAREATEQEG